jgi:hypothetical protein
MSEDSGKPAYPVGGGNSAFAPSYWINGSSWGPKGKAIMVGKWYRAYCVRHGNRAGVDRTTQRINLEARK